MAISACLGTALHDVDAYAMVTLDADGCITSWNRGAARLTGVPEEQALGMGFGLVRSIEDGQPDSPAVPNAHTPEEHWWHRADGTLLLVDELITALAEDGGLLVIARDLTAQMDAEERAVAGRTREAEGLGREHELRVELQASERRAAFLAEASSILVAASLNLQSTLRSLVRLAVTRLSDWCAIHATSSETAQIELVQAGHRDPRLETALLEQLRTSTDREWLREIQDVLRTGQGRVLHKLPELLRQPIQPGDRAPAMASGQSAMIAPLLGRGKVIGAMTLISASAEYVYDASDLALAEELGRRAAIALDNARLYHEAQEANRAKTDFLAVMSHELRTPLNAIMGYTDLLDAEITGPMTERQRAQLTRIRSSARHLLQLIEEILAYARLEGGADELVWKDASAADVMQAAASVIEPLAEAKSLQFDVQLPDPPIELKTDAAKVRQILVNLLSNAVKFTHDGGVSMRASRAEEQVVFEVRDTGIGIAEDQVGRIFDPFCQVEPPNTRQVGGTGLGLSVARRYARMLGGDIDVRSEPGRGSTFCVTLPVRP